MLPDEASKPLVLAERKGRVLIVTLNRPDKLNALSKQLIGELAALLQSVRHDDSLGCVVITGAGKAFSAGADIFDMLARGLASYEDPERLQAWRAIEDFPKPLVAAINGYAFGGGLELALLCDIAIAADSAQLAFPEIRIGSFPGDGGTQRLPRLAGKSFAMQMILTGDPIDAATAERKGLLSEVVDGAKLLPRAVEIAEKIAANSTAVASVAKQAVGAAFRLPLPAGLDHERELTARAFALEDRMEGLRAFADKRPPRFKDR